MAYLALLTLTPLALIFSSCLVSHALADPIGFKISLSHVDAGRPFSPAERIHRVALRTRQRRKILEARLLKENSTSTNFQVPITSAGSEYKMEFTMGSPKRTVTAVLDTGSELIWTDCTAKLSTPVYDPAHSFSFAQLPCSSPLYDYQILKQFKSPRCRYRYIYGSASTEGVLATETFGFGGRDVVNLTFGCSDAIKGSIAGTAGIVGLGQGKLSLISQLKLGKFSHCLTSFTSSSKSTLLLGSHAKLKSSAARRGQSTPFLDDPNLYYVNVRGISLGKTLLQIPRSIFNHTKGEMNGAAIDSGTGQTQLPRAAYDVVVREIKNLVGLPARNMSATVGLDQCFEVASWPPPRMPEMTFHLEGGASMSFPAANYMYSSQTTGAFCLVMQPTKSNLTIIGNYQQQNMHVVYDLEARMISFEPAQCDRF